MQHTLSPDDTARLLAGGHPYRSKISVHAVPVNENAEWQTHRRDVLQAAAGDRWVTDGETQWTVAGDLFRATYENIGDGLFRKTATVTAVTVGEPFAVQTLEGLATGEPGDWLVRNPTGECWPIPADVFNARYEAS